MLQDLERVYPDMCKPQANYSSEVNMGPHEYKEGASGDRALDLNANSCQVPPWPELCGGCRVLEISWGPQSLP